MATTDHTIALWIRRWRRHAIKRDRMIGKIEDIIASNPTDTDVSLITFLLNIIKLDPIPADWDYQVPEKIREIWNELRTNWPITEPDPETWVRGYLGCPVEA